VTHDELSASRLLCADVLTTEVEPDGASASFSTAARTLSVGDVEVGLWEAGPGSDVDTEVDEVFLVLSGAGTVTFADGSAITLRPGVLVRLREGDRTTWEITERLRKLYVS
jgi:uncharacterized cupin superfamily protein